MSSGFMYLYFFNIVIIFSGTDYPITWSEIVLAATLSWLWLGWQGCPRMVVHTVSEAGNCGSGSDKNAPEPELTCWMKTQSLVTLVPTLVDTGHKEHLAQDMD